MYKFTGQQVKLTSHRMQQNNSALQY